MIRLGLIGYPLGHSLSPRIHAAALAACGLDGNYSLFPIPPEDREGLRETLERVRSGGIDGLNVTIPHKQNVIPLLDELTPAARAIGAVNTIYARGETLIGENTDAPGFMADLERFLAGPQPPIERRALAIVLGAGGAARAAAWGLIRSGWKVAFAARRVEQAETLANRFRADNDTELRAVPLEAEALRPLLRECGLIVNATPVGMAPNTGASPWPEALPFPTDAAVYDMVYRPRETRLIREARLAGVRAESGLGMLVEQAARAFECWTGRPAPRRAMLEAANQPD